MWMSHQTPSSHHRDPAHHHPMLPCWEPRLCRDGSSGAINNIQMWINPPPQPIVQTANLVHFHSAGVQLCLVMQKSRDGYVLSQQDPPEDVLSVIKPVFGDAGTMHTHSSREAWFLSACTGGWKREMQSAGHHYKCTHTIQQERKGLEA